MTKNAYFSLLTPTKQLLFLTFYDKTARIGASFQSQTDARMEPQTGGQTDVEVEIVI